MRSSRGRKILYGLLVLLLISPLIVGLDPIEAQEWELVERGENFIRLRSLIAPGNYTWESAPQWVFDGSNHVPYIYEETDDYYQVQSGFIGARLYKSGYAEFWDPNMTEVRLYEETWEVQYWSGNKWSVCDVYSPTFSVSTDEMTVNITASYITDWPNNGERVFEVKYIFREGRPLKHEITFTSHASQVYEFRVVQSWAGIVAAKVKYDDGEDVIISPTIVNSSQFKFLKEDGNLSVFENQQDMYYGWNETTGEIYILENGNLQPVEIDIHAQGLKADFIFSNWTLAQGETLEVDPDSATLNYPWVDGHIYRSSGGIYTDYSTSDYCKLGDLAGGQEYRSYFIWYIGSIPDVVDVSLVKFKYEIISYNAWRFLIRAINNEATWGSLPASTKYTECMAGEGMGRLDMTSTGENKEWTLASVYAHTNLEGALLDGDTLWGFGLTDVDNDYPSAANIAATEEPGVPIPTLYVEYTVANLTPTITSASISDRDDTYNVYEMESYYTFVAVVNDADGATDIASVYLYGTQATTVRFEVRATSLTGTPAYSIAVGGTIIDLDAGSCSWVEDGEEGTATFKIRFEWDFTDEVDLELRVYVADGEASAGPTTKQTDYFDVLGRLVTSNLAASDGRVNVGGTSTISGDVNYATTISGDTASTKYPLDAQFTAIHAHSSAHSSLGNDATIVNGAFSFVATMPSAVGTNTIHIYLDLVADYTDADAPDGDTVAVIGDQVVFKTATTLETADAHVNSDATGEWYGELMYDFDDVEVTDGTVSLNTGSMSWDSGGDHRWEYTNAPGSVTDVARNIASISGNTHGITSLASAVTDDSETIEFDEVVFQTGTFEVTDGRINLDATGEWYVKLMLDNNDAVITSGTITLNTGTLTYDSGADARWEYTNALGALGLVTRNVATASGLTGGITKINSAVTGDSEGIIFDRIQATGTSISDGHDDINDEVTIDWTLIYDYDNAEMTDGTVTIEGEATAHQGSGVWRASVTEASVTTTTFNEFTATGNAHGITAVDANGQSDVVVWDRVYATGTTVSDSRNDINDDITVDWTLKYESDDELYDNGDETVTIEGESASHLGSGVWRVTLNEATPTSITANEFTASGDPYGLTEVDANSQSDEVIWDRVYATATSISDTRDDINNEVTIDWTLKYEYDDELYDNGDETVTIEGESAAHQGSGVWRISITKTFVTSVTYNEFTASGDPYGLTEANANSQTDKVIWDALMIDIWVDDTRTDVSANVEVRANITLAYDQIIIDSGDAVSLNGSAMAWDAGNGWWELAVDQASVTEMRYQISSITDSTYGITSLGRLTFDGVNDRVIVAHSESLAINDSITLSAQIYPFEFGNNRGLLRKVTSVDGYALRLIGDKFNIVIRESNSELDGKTSTGTIPSNSWSTVTGVFDGTSLITYLDGSYDSSTVASCTLLTTNTSPLHIYRNSYWAVSEYYNGSVGTTKIYNRSMSALEEKAAYRGLRISNGLVLDLETTGINVEDGKWYDTSGEGNDGTIIEATVIEGSYDDYFVLPIWDRIEIVSVAFDDSRVNINTAGEVRYVLRYDFDDVAFETGDGSIVGFTWDAGNSWWDKAVTSPAAPGHDVYDENDLGALTDTNYGLTVYEDDAGANLIGDQVEIVSVAFDDARVNIGVTVEARYKLRYDYDDVEIDDGKATIIGWTWDGGNSWWDKSVTAPATPIAELYDENDISGVFTDDTYSLTVWEDDAGTNLIGDRINFKTATLETTDDHVNSDATGEWYAELLYEYDSAEVTDGTVTLNAPGSDYFGSQYRGLFVTGEYYDSPGEKFAVRFTAQEDKSVANVSLYVQREGTDWNATVGIQGDNGGEPDGTYIGANNITIDGVLVDNTGWWTFTLASTVPLTDQTVYHIVVDVIWADGTHKLYFRGTQNRYGVFGGYNTWLTTHDLADPNLRYEANTAGSWALRTRTPIFVITYTDGSFIGQPYTSTELAQKVYGSNFHGQWFYSPDYQITIDTLGIYIRKQSTPGDLNISLETESGLILRSVIIPVEDGYPLFSWEDGSIELIELNASTLYRLRLRSPGGDGGNYWDINHPYMSYGAEDIHIDNATFGYNEMGGRESRWDGGAFGAWYWDDLSFRLRFTGGTMEWDAGDGRWEYTNAPAAVVDVTRIIASVSGNTYGITALNSSVTSDSETIEFDEVVFLTGTLEVLDGRIDVDATGTWYGKLMLDNNDAVITSGTITLNTGTMSYDGGDSRWEYTNVTGSVASVSRNIASVSGLTGGITKVHSTVTSDSEAIIFDRIQITDLAIVDGRVSTGTIGTFYATAILEYDSHALGAGDWVVLGGYNFTWTPGESRFEHGRVESSVLTRTPNSYTSGSEATFGISVGDINGQTASLIWDRIKVYWETVDEADNRTDIDENVEWRLRAVLEYDEHPLGSGDYLTTPWGNTAWDGTNSWHDISHTESGVGAYTISFTAGSEASYGITSITENITETSVIFDRIVATLTANITSPDAGQAVGIIAIAVLDYDDVIIELWHYNINRNGTYFAETPTWDSHDVEITYQYTIHNATEETYDIEACTSNILTIQWGDLQIDIFNTSTPDERVGTDTVAIIYWNARYGSNNSVVPSGNITVGEVTYDFNGTGWAESNHTEATVGSYDYNVTAVNVEGETDFTQTTANPNLLFDQVRITSLSTPYAVVDINDTVSILATADLQYDTHPLGAGDTIVISGETFTWNASLSKFVLTTSYPNGIILYLDEITTVIETTYGITSGTMNNFSLSVEWKGETGGGEQPSVPEPGAPPEPTPIDPGAVEVTPEEPGIEDILPEIPPPPPATFLFGMAFLILIMALPPIYFWMRKEKPLQEVWGEELRAARKGFWGMVWFKRDDEDRDRPKLQRRRSIPGRLVGELRQRTIQSREALQRTVTSGARGLERTAGIVGRPGEVVRRSVRSKEGLRRRREVLSGLGRVPKRTIQGGQGLVRKTFEGGRSTWRRVRAFGDRRD